MLKLLSKIFKEKPPALDTKAEVGMTRMTKMRRKTTEMALMLEAVTDCDRAGEQNDLRKDILSKARDMEISTSYKGYSSSAREMEERKIAPVVKDWHERINHLSGV